MNTYNVTFVFDFTTITTTLMALSDEVAAVMAVDYIKSDTGIPEDIFEQAQDVKVELLDVNVL